jgi:hypothetical protein
MNPSSEKGNFHKVKKGRRQKPKDGYPGSHDNCSPAHPCKECSFLVTTMLDMAFQRLTGF